MKKMFTEKYLKECREIVLKEFKKIESDKTASFHQYVHDVAYCFASSMELLDLCVGIELLELEFHENKIHHLLNSTDVKLASSVWINEKPSINSSINLRRMINNYNRLNSIKDKHIHDLREIGAMINVSTSYYKSVSLNYYYDFMEYPIEEVKFDV